MISVQEADHILKESIHSFGIEHVPIVNSVGRVLAENIFCDSDLPPFHRVAMDGIAIKFSSYESGTREFTIEGMQAAGTPQLTLNSPDNCLEAMTGAILPLSTDTVIRVEDLSIKDGVAILKNDAQIKQGQNIHYKGSDKKKNGLVIHKNNQINGPIVGVLASVGLSKIPVYAIPKIAIISTGNELVEVEEKPLPHQIRRSNVYAIQQTLHHYHFTNTQLFHLPDIQKKLDQELPKLLNQFNVLFFSGGVSMGKFDLLPQSLKNHGVDQKFHKIAQKPGKPFWFGLFHNKPVFALPGNPVSSLVCLIRYALPHLKQRMNCPEKPALIHLSSEMNFNKSLTLFQAVQYEQNADGKGLGHMIKGNGSGDFASLANSTGFVELDAAQQNFPINSLVPYYPW